MACQDRDVVLIRGDDGKPDYFLMPNGDKQPAYFFPGGLRSIDIDPATGLTPADILRKIEDDFARAYGVRYRDYQRISDDPA